VFILFFLRGFKRWTKGEEKGLFSYIARFLYIHCGSGWLGTGRMGIIVRLNPTKLGSILVNLCKRDSVIRHIEISTFLGG